MSRGKAICSVLKTIRLPHIPDYNTQDDVRYSQDLLRAMDFTLFDVFSYSVIKRQVEV